MPFGKRLLIEIKFFCPSLNGLFCSGQDIQSAEVVFKIRMRCFSVRKLASKNIDIYCKLGVEENDVGRAIKRENIRKI